MTSDLIHFFSLLLHIFLLLQNIFMKFLLFVVLSINSSPFLPPSLTLNVYDMTILNFSIYCFLNSIRERIHTSNVQYVEFFKCFQFLLALSILPLLLIQLLITLAFSFPRFVFYCRRPTSQGSAAMFFPSFLILWTLAKMLLLKLFLIQNIVGK